MTIEEILSKLPEINEFLTPAEMDANTFALEKQYPDTVKVDQVGESEKHHPIYRLRIGNGKKKVLIFGCPHPNEPIGAMMIENFTKILCENESLLTQFDATFHFIKCVDPDGLNLNAGWLKGPFNYYNYASNFFRPAGKKQVEWTFPFHYKTYHFDKVLPETQAIMKVIDEVEPDLMYSLHNSSFGGVYWYLSKKEQAIIDALPSACKRVNLPLSLGEPEVPFCEVYGQAIYELPQSAASYDFYEANLDKDPAEIMTSGGCSADYLDTKKKDALTIICEMPYFYCPDSNDVSLCDDITRKDAILKSFAISDEIKTHLKEVYDLLLPYGDPTSSCMIALEERVNDKQEYREAQIAMMEANKEEYDTLATKASRFDNLIGNPWYQLLAFGMVISEAKAALTREQSTDAKQQLNDCIAKSEAYLQKKCDEINDSVPCQPIPIKSLVSVQLESVLLALNVK